MKRNDENQNSNFEKRVYRKKNLEDMDFDFDDDADGDFRLSPNEESLDYMPGVDDIDHFDFDDKDVEHYREMNEREVREQEERRKRRKAEKEKLAEKENRRLKNKQRLEAVGISDEEDEDMRQELSRKKKTNKEILRVTYIMMAMFIGMIGYFIYFDAVASKEVVNNAHNSRLVKLAENVIRGEILSADGEILAESIDDGEGHYSRYYPYGSVFAHVVGTNEINKSGIELTADFNLISSDVHPLEKVFNEIRGHKNSGNNVITTLDAGLQQVAYDALGDRKGAVVAIEPSTGKVLAMVSKPDYNPNTLAENYESILSDTESKVLLNQSTQGLFIPGSIFKIVTSLAYMRSGADISNYGYDCDGRIYLDTDDGESYINCFGQETHGYVDFTDSFAESCNTSFANLGLLVGASKMNEVSNALLFNQALPTKFTTAISKFRLLNSDSDWQIGATAMGQGNTVISPMHAAMIVSAIANDGNLMEPYVIDKIQNADGSDVEHYKPESYGNLMTLSEADRLTEMMKAVVDYGTAYKLDGRYYDVAGKTGTAEVMGSDNNAWFVGFAPADDPKIAVCVLVEDVGTASSYAVPIAGELFDVYLD